MISWDERFEREGIAYKGYLQMRLIGLNWIQMLVLWRMDLRKGNRHSIWVPIL